MLPVPDLQEYRVLLAKKLTVPVVQWIRRLPPEEEMAVRVSPGTLLVNNLGINCLFTVRDFVNSVLDTKQIINTISSMRG